MSKVAIVFWSATGNTETMANCIAEGAGANGTIVPCAEMTPAKLAEFDVVAFGCPAMGAEQLEESEFEPMFAALEGSLNGKKIALFGSYGWGDGMNVFASSNVSYDGVFCRNSDDCSTVYATRKGFRGGCRNILMENSTLWADVAHPIMIGLHGNVERPDTIENVTYRNIDILDHCEKQLDYQGCFGISCGDNNLVRDITFDNIRVEDFRQGQLVNIRIFFNKKYCLAPGRGVYNVLFKDIDYCGTRSEMSVIAGYDDLRPVSGITFENLRINGVRIADDMPGKPKWYKTGDMARIFIGEHVDNVVFK